MVNIFNFTYDNTWLYSNRDLNEELMSLFEEGSKMYLGYIVKAFSSPNFKNSQKLQKFSKK